MYNNNIKKQKHTQPQIIAILYVQNNELLKRLFIFLEKYALQLIIEYLLFLNMCP